MGQGSSKHDEGTGRRIAGRVVRVTVFVLLLGLGACAEYKKLSAGGSIPEVFYYDILGQDRAPAYYYQLVRDSHKECDFCYRCGQDEYLVDKNVDAVQRLGKASFGRLEGEAEVVELFAAVLSEDCSALARSSAANSLTKIALRLPPYPGPRVEDRGDRFKDYMEQLDRLYGWDGTCARPPPGRRQQAVRLLTAIGNLDIIDYVVTMRSLRFFYGRPYLVDEADPEIRAAIDTALVKRMRALILDALQGAVLDETPTVRSDAIKGLKMLGDRSAVDIVLQSLSVESDWLVRMDAVEYLGRVGTREGVIALIGLLEDPNASVRHKAHSALIRIAGRDYGFRPETWKYWARQLDPNIDFGDDESGNRGSRSPGGAVSGP